MTIRTPITTRSAPVSFDEAEGTVEVVYATETPVSRWGYVEQLVVSPDAIDATRLDSGAVNLLVQHDAWSNLPIGNVIAHRIENGKAIATIKLSVADEHKGIVENIRAGVLSTTSVGYSVVKSEEEVGADGVVTYRVTRWQPVEISLVSIPADPNSRTRALPGQQIRRRTFTSADEGAEMATETETQTDTTDENVDQTTINDAPENETTTEPADEAPSDGERAAQIVELCTRHQMPSGFAARHIRSGATLPTVRAAVLDAIAARSAPPMNPARITRDQRENTTRQASASIFGLIAGTPVTEQDGGAFRSLRLVDIARRALGADAEGRSDREVVSLAIRSGMHTSSDFSFTQATGAAIERRVREIFASLELPLQPLVRNTLVSDFRPVATYSIGGFPELRETAEGAEYEAGTVSTESGEFRISKYGRVLTLSFEAIINDDLRLLDTAIRGAAAKGVSLRNKLIRAAFGAKLADNKTLFHASRGNLIADALSVEGLSKARTILRKVADIDGEAMNLAPKYLIVSPDLETEAQQLVSPITATLTGSVNPFASSLELIVDPVLSGDEWMVAADPAYGDAIELADLRGYEGVRVEEIPNHLVDGISYRARTFGGAHPTGWRGFVKSTGNG